MKQIVLLILLLGLLFARCVPAAETAPPGREADATQVTLQFGVAGSPSKGWAVDPHLLSNINVYAFYSKTGQPADYQYLDGQTECRMKLSAGNSYTFYTIANTGRLGAQSRTQVAGYRHTIAQASDLAGNGGLLLCGQLTATISRDDVLPLTLARATARIQLSVDTSALENGTRLSFTGVRLRDVAAQVDCFSPSRATSATQLFSTGASLSGAELDALYSTGVYLYTYENRQGTLLPDNTQPELKVPPTAQQGLCTYVELEADYESALRRGTVRYRFYPGADNLTDFDLVRNTNYRIHAAFTGSGINEVSWRVVTEELYDRPRQITVQPASYIFDDYDLHTTLQAVVAPATVYPSYAGLTWHSSNPSVASVNETGKVISHAEGTCVITATSTDTPSVYGTAQITVNAPVYSLRIVQADSVLYNDPYKTQRSIWQVELTPASTGYEPLWESSDPAVVSAFNYQTTPSVFTTGSGEAVITAIHPKDPTLRESVRVRVVQPVIEVHSNTQVTIPPYGTSHINASLVNGVPGDSLTYTSTISPLVRVDASGKISPSGRGCSVIDIRASHAVTRQIKVSVISTDNYMEEDYTLSEFLDGKVNENDSLYSWRKDRNEPMLYYYNKANGLFTGYEINSLPNITFKRISGSVNYMTLTAKTPVCELFKLLYIDIENLSVTTTIYTHYRATAVPLYCQPSNPQLSLAIGQSAEMEYTTNNNSWKKIIRMELISSNPQVATVDSLGNVRAQSPGTATLNMYHPTSGLLRTWQVTVTP